MDIKFVSQLTGFILTVYSAYLLARSNSSMSTEIILESSKSTFFGSYNKNISKSLVKQKINTNFGLFILVLSIPIQIFSYFQNDAISSILIIIYIVSSWFIILISFFAIPKIEAIEIRKIFNEIDKLNHKYK